MGFRFPTVMSEQEAAIYANSYYVTFKRDEFYIQLRLTNPEGEKNLLGVYLSPWNAKGLMKALKTMVEKYERSFHPIGEPKLAKERKDAKKFEKKGFSQPVYT